MKNNIIIGINLGDSGSTGVIMRNSLEYAAEHGDFDYLIIVPKDKNKPNTYAYFKKNNIVDKIDRRLIHKSLGNPDGLYEYRATKRIIHKIKEQCKKYDKVIVHLHNIHMASIDFRVLFEYLHKEKRISNIFYTIHDCWPYTGGCYYYNYVNCYGWITGCKANCVQKYGNSTFNTAKIYELKKKYTILLKDKMILLPVSSWISDEISKSFLKDFRKIIIHGETNMKRLPYRDELLIDKLNLRHKKIVLTIAAYWDPWKGKDYIYKVAEKLPNNYVMLVVGDNRFDKKEIDNIIHIKSVSSDELSRYYSIADVYMSTSQSESLGLTTCEAQICGVPVVAFGHTAIKETFNDNTGILVGEDNDIDKMVKAITKVVELHPFKQDDIIANGKRFAKYSTAKKYFGLYLNCVK